MSHVIIICTANDIRHVSLLILIQKMLKSIVIISPSNLFPQVSASSSTTLLPASVEMDPWFFSLESAKSLICVAPYSKRPFIDCITWSVSPRPSPSFSPREHSGGQSFYPYIATSKELDIKTAPAIIRTNVSSCILQCVNQCLWIYLSCCCMNDPRIPQCSIFNNACR